MRRFLVLVIVFSFFLLFSAAVTLAFTNLDQVTAGPEQTASPVVELIDPTLVPTYRATDTPTPLPSPSPTIAPLVEDNFTVRYHPDGGLFVGDQVSLEVIAPPGAELEDRSVRVAVDGLEGERLGPVEFETYGIAGRYQATMRWAWDTTDLEPGTYTLTFSVDPVGPTWTESVALAPADAVPPPEPEAHWETTETDCCLVYYITGTDSARDLPMLAEMLDEQAEEVVEHLDTDFEEPIPVVFLPRVLGHGGFASDRIAVSYLDRNYAGSDPAIVLHHEMVHLLDRRLGGELRPSIFVEGLAVYLSGGHFKAEPIIPRAAALLDLGLYLPVVSLADDFYPAQHEIGYLEGAALVEYMVETWGWEAFSDFYRDIHPHDSGSQAQAIDAALREHFELSFEQLEERFIAYLRSQPVSPEHREDVLQTVAFYDTVRRYQQALDPSAYFMTAWLPDALEMREQGIVADYVRHPSEPVNLALETMLVAADAHLRLGEYDQSAEILQAVNAVLDAIDRDAGDPFAVHPLAADYAAIVHTLNEAGYEPQQIEVEQKTARALASRPGSEVVELDLVFGEDGWRIAGDSG